jgi:hypothetical protein
MIVSFEDDALGDAAAELLALGADYARDILLYLQRVHNGSIDFRTLAPFSACKGVEMFHASGSGNKFAVFSVEIDGMGDTKITLMLAGQHGVPMQAGNHSWDGNNYSALKAGILDARATVWFV